MSEKQIETLFIVTTSLSGTATPNRLIETQKARLNNSHRMKLRRIRELRNG